MSRRLLNAVWFAWKVTPFLTKKKKKGTRK